MSLVCAKVYKLYFLNKIIYRSKRADEKLVDAWFLDLKEQVNKRTLDYVLFDPTFCRIMDDLEEISIDPSQIVNLVATPTADEKVVINTIISARF